MVYIYLSDESVALAERIELPQKFHHIEMWLPILQEVCQWRSVPFRNQIALPIGVRPIREIETVISRLKWNSPTTYEMEFVCGYVKQELKHRKQVVTPQDDEELEAFLAELRKGSDEEE